MNTREFFLIIFAVAIGSLIGLLAWTLIVKSQIQASVTGNSTVNTLLALFGPKTSSS